MGDTTIFFGAALAAILATIAWVDWRQQLIPDVLNLALAATGLVYQTVAAPELLWVQISAGLAALGIFWTLRRSHAWRTGRIGLGLGDVKMAGASALWLSPWSLPYFVFVASLSALAFIAVRQLAQQNVTFETRQPFGPFLSVGLLATWLAEQHFPDLLGAAG